MSATIVHRPSRIGAAVATVALLAASAVFVAAQAPPKSQAAPAADGRDPMAASAGAVVLDGDTLFFLYDGTSAYSSAERAKRVSTALLIVATKGIGAGDSVRVYNDARRTEVSLGSQPLFFVTDSDAAAVGLTRAAAAELYAKRVRGMLPIAAAQRTAGALWRDVGLAATQTGIALVLVLIARLIFPRMLRALDRSRARLTEFIAGLGIGGLTGDRVVDFLLGLTGLARWVFYTVLVAIYVPAVLSDFPQTADFALRLIASVASPLKSTANAIVDYLPDLVILIIIGFGARLVLRGVRGFFNALRAGNIRIKNFDPEWAAPTFQIARVMILALSFALMFPYLPGANSDAIKGVSIFIGLLVSFGSSSAISNLVAGLVLLYSRAFHVGDWVRIGAVEGAVIARSLLVTRLRTPKNVEVSVPNAVVLAGPIENYTAQAELGKLILHTTVTIGYDAPWRTVHDLLIAAAHATADIESDPAPFVLQTGLGDFNVAYQLNAFTTRADLQPALYGDLHRNIQEKFNAAGIEIMSPNFFALRDGNTVTIPESQRPPSYRAPAFRISTDTK